MKEKSKYFIGDKVLSLMLSCSNPRTSKKLTFKRVEFSGKKIPMLDFVLTKKDLKK